MSSTSPDPETPFEFQFNRPLAEARVTLLLRVLGDASRLVPRVMWSGLPALATGSNLKSRTKSHRRLRNKFQFSRP